MYPTDFDSSHVCSDIVKIFEAYKFFDGRIIGGSKTIYREENEGNLIIFNANVITKEHGKIWYGDLDLTKDHKTLIEIADRLNTVLYVLYEKDGRFGEENNPIDVLINRAAWNTKEIASPTSEWYREKMKSK